MYHTQVRKAMEHRGGDCAATDGLRRRAVRPPESLNLTKPKHLLAPGSTGQKLFEGGASQAHTPYTALHGSPVVADLENFSQCSCPD